MPRKIKFGAPLSDKQKAVQLNANCMRNMASLEKAFRAAGHAALATRVSQMDAAFRRELEYKVGADHAKAE